MQMTGNEPGAPRPTGLPDDTLQAAFTLAAHLGTKMNIPGPGQVGLLMPTGITGQIHAAAEVASALALADIARSLRIIAGRETDQT